MIVGEASEGFLETYGIFPILGRGIHADDTRDGAPAVALLGHAYWQRAFGGDRNVLGRDIRVQNRPVTIVGVLPAGFYKETAVWQAPGSSTASMIDRRGIGHSGDRAAAAGRHAGAGAGGSRAVARPPRRWSARRPHPVRVVIESMYDDETRQFGATINTLSMAVGLILIDRVRQRRRPAAGARGDPARGAGDPRVDRRGPRPAGPAAAHREPAAGAGRRRRRRAARLRLARLAGRAHSAVAAGQFAGGDQRDRARVRARPHGRDGAALRPGAGPQALARAEDDQHDAGRRRTRRRAAVETRRAVAHRHRGRAGAGADDRRRPDPSQLRQARVGRSRIQRRERPDRSKSSRSTGAPRSA